MCYCVIGSVRPSLGPRVRWGVLVLVGGGSDFKRLRAPPPVDSQALICSVPRGPADKISPRKGSGCLKTAVALNTGQGTRLRSDKANHARRVGGGRQPIAKDDIDRYVSEGWRHQTQLPKGGEGGCRRRCKLPAWMKGGAG